MKRFLPLLLLLVLVAPVCGQELKTLVDVSDETSADSSSSQPTPQAKSKQAQPYVFPTSRERLDRYVKSTVGPFSLVSTSISAGISQWKDDPDEWEQGAAGYGKRFASSFGTNAIQQTLTYGLDVALKLDTGFRRSQHKGFGPRFKDALAENLTSRNRSGKRVISAPRFVGIYSSRVIAAETWYPSRYNYKDGLRSATYSLASGFAMNLLREFVIRF
jgi:hypothetical protein